MRRFLSKLAGAILVLLPALGTQAQDISATARTEIGALLAEKDARTPAQQKMDSQLVYLAKQSRNEVVAPGLAAFEAASAVAVDDANLILIDLSATVNDDLINAITQSGGVIVNQFAPFNAIRARVPVEALERLAARNDVRTLGPAARAITNVGSVTSEGDRTHRANTARTTFGVTGAGVKIGVMSDGINSLAASKANGNLNANATFISGQAGSGDEGTAMMEIIQDLVPDATLIFATAFNGTASFAANILALQAAGCTIIVDDVTYFNESPFQDEVISQAVNTVSAAGVMFFSSARNSGNKNDGTSGTWEGDFVSGGAVAAPVTGTGNLLNFGGGTTFNTVAAGGSSRRVDMFWSDPNGASTNDYDLFVLNSTGTTVLRSSTNVQNGTQNPYEATATLNVGERIVVVKRSGAADRFIHLDTGRAVLTISTNGNVRGHNASGAANAFSVAATNVANSPSPGFFVGGATNPVETFSSDGPRRMFFDPSGTPLTPGNFTSTGGQVLNKPDITAADGGVTSVPGFTSFFGTSAAAPHAAAIAGLLQSYNPALTAAQIRTLMSTTALDIEGAGFDRDSGVGIVMALAAMQMAPSPDPLTIVATDMNVTGLAGGPFTPTSATYTLTNTSPLPLNWSASKTQSWTNLSTTSGTLAAGASEVVTLLLDEGVAEALAVGFYTDTVIFTNLTTTVSRNIPISLNISAPSPPVLFDSFTNASLTYSGSLPRTFMGIPMTLGAAGGTSNITIAGGTAYLVSTTAASYTNVRLNITFWGTASGAIGGSTPAFSNLLGTFSFDLGPLATAENTFYEVPFTLPSTVVMPGQTGGVVINWQGNTGSGLVSNENLTSLIRYDPALNVGSLTVGTPGTYGFYLNASSETNGNFLGSSFRFFSGGFTNQCLALQLVGTLAPTVITNVASNIDSTTATLNASVNPGGSSTTAQFQYGTTTSYGSVASITLVPNDGTTLQNVSANLSNLTPNTTYHYRVTATNEFGPNSGLDRTFTTTATSNAPIITGTVAGQAVTDQNTIQPFSGTTISYATTPSLSLAISVNLDNTGKGSFTTLNGFTNAGGGSYLFNGTAAAATTAIRGMVFTPAANRVPAGQTETTFMVVGASDGILPPAINNVTTVVSTSVNDNPVLGLPGPAITYIENSEATVIDGAAAVGDVDSPDFAGGALTVDFSANGSTDDRLAIRNQGTGAGQIGVSGSSVSFAGTPIGTFTGGTNGSTPLVVSIASSSATAAVMQALAQNVTFQNVSDNPSLLTRTVRFVLTDGDGGTSSAITESIHVTAVNDAPTLTAISNPASILEDATVQTINLSGISAGGGESQTLSVTAVSNNNAVIPNPSVSYTSANATGTLNYAPVANASGSATITVTVTDNGGTANDGVNQVVRTFLVVVTAVNDAPTLTAIANPPTIPEDAAVQTVNLAGISAGAGESQTISVFAESDNDALIPNPSVTYTSANATGTLNYTPVADASGSATITVTIQDSGGTANGGVNQIVRTFVVNVAPVNDAPTLAPISNPMAILEDDLSEQIIDLAGISAGADEVQTLVVTAASGSPSIIPHPTVSYTSDNSNGFISYAALPNTFGPVEITVTVQDNGGTINGGVNQFQRTFTVNITPVNDQPTIAAIDDPTPILQDAPIQSIPMSGISAGPNETQVLSVSAVSSNPALIPHPSVSYTSANTTGTINYAPVTGASGTATITVTVLDDGGTSNSGINTVTETFTVVVYAPVVITVPPQPLTLNPGAPAHFTVTATGTAPLSYQWRKNGEPIPGADEDFYHIDEVEEDDQASYDVIVSNVVGPVPSAAALLSVNDPVLITSEPLALVVNQGEQAQFAVAASGTAPIEFQWRKDGESMPLAQSSMFTIPAAQIADEGMYDVVVSNIVGPKTSVSVRLTVLRGTPRIIRQPIAQTVALDTAVTFTVKAGGTSPFTYQWRKAGKNIPGATADSLLIPAVQLTDTGSYTVQVKNALGSITSDAALLTVNKATAYTFSTLAGKAGILGAIDGTGDVARLSQPDQGVRDSLGNLFFTDRDNHAIRKVTPDGEVSVFAGNPGAAGTQDGTGTSARFSSPTGIGIDTADNLFVADSGSHLIRKVTPAGEVTTFAGTANVAGATDAMGNAASFRAPWGVAVDASFNVYVADAGNHTVRKILPDGTVTTLAGLAQQAGNADAQGTLARFNKPAGLAVDSLGILYVADELNHAVRKIAGDGSVTTLAGLKGTSGAIDAVGTLARFKAPDGVSVDTGGNVFVADSGNHTLRLITPTGRVTTIGGLAGKPGNTNGLGSFARFRSARGIVVESQTSIYVADSANHTLRKGISIGLPQIDTPPASILVGLGQPATFTVATSGGAPQSFQWSKNGKNIPAATASTYGIAVTKLTDAATYRVLVKNAAGALTSVGARLGVVSQVASLVTVNENATTSLTASATGDNLIFEWLKNGKPLTPAANLTGITSAKLTISKATIADAGVYACSIRLGSLRLETGNFTVSVRQKPVVATFSPSPWTVSDTVTDAITVMDNSVLNAPTLFSVAGLPKGMTFNTKTGQLGGKPNAPGTYTLTITATNAAGKSVAQIVVITVSPVPANAQGAFNGLVERNTQLSAPVVTPPNQKLQGLGGSMNLNVTSTGNFTGTLKLEGKSYSMPGRLDTHGAAGNPTATVVIKRGTSIPALTLALTINAATGELTGTLTDGLISPQVNVRAFRNPWLVSNKPALHNPATALAGMYTAALTISDPTLLGDPDLPQGRGYGTLTVTTGGAVSWSGVLADGTPATLSTTMGSNGEIPLHWMLYSNTGSAQGWVQATAGTNTTILDDNELDTMLDLTQADPEDQHLFDWFKKPQAPNSSTLSYKGGFDLHKLVVAGGGYVKPSANEIILGMASVPNNALLTFSGGGIETSLTYLNAGNGGPSASLGGKPFQMTAPGNALFQINPAAIVLTIDADKGTIKGSFTLTNDPDPTDLTAPFTTVSRKVTFAGLLVPRLGIGVGQYQLPELPSLGPPKTTISTSPRWSGQLLLEAAP